MQIYLPIADLPVDIFLVLAMGLAVGFISGMFGIGGGFLMTPLLIFIGISPAVAVASVASHIAASSCSGVISYWRRRAVDLALGLMLLAGGILGTAVGVWLFTVLRGLGQLDLTIGISYVVLLSTVGGLMISESVRAILRQQQGKPAMPRRGGAHTWDNLVACCVRCNNLKGDRTPEEKGWTLRVRPRAPRGPAWVVRGADARDPSWEAFLGDAA